MLQLNLQAVVAVTVILLLNREKSLQTSEWRSDDKIREFRIRAREDENTLVLVAKDFVFNCRGRIDQWSLQWCHRDGSVGCTILFHFYVLRQSEDCGNVMIVGENVFTEILPQNGDSTIRNVNSVFNVESEDRLMFQEGDFIGLAVTFLSCPSDTRLWVAGRTDIQSSVYYGTFDSFSDRQPTLLEFCTSLELNMSIVPFITAVVSQISASSATSSFYPTPVPESTITLTTTPTSQISASSATSSFYPTPVPESTITLTTTPTSQISAPTVKSSESLYPTSIAVAITPTRRAYIAPSTSSKLHFRDSSSFPAGLTEDETTSNSVTPLSESKTIDPTTTESNVKDSLTDTRERVSEKTIVTSTTYHTDSSSTLDAFTRVNITQSSDQLILILVGAGSSTLVLLGVAVTTTLLCLWRCLHRKDNAHEEEPTDVHGQDQNRRPSAYSSAIYDLPSSGFVSEEPMASTEVCMHIYDLPLSPASKETFHVPKLGQSPQQVRHNATNSSSLPEGQGYMMRINGAYGSQTT